MLAFRPGHARCPSDDGKKFKAKEYLTTKEILKILDSCEKQINQALDTEETIERSNTLDKLLKSTQYLREIIGKIEENEPDKKIPSQYPPVKEYYNAYRALGLQNSPYSSPRPSPR